jgi:hypothetical protein
VNDKSALRHAWKSGFVIALYLNPSLFVSRKCSKSKSVKLISLIGLILKHIPEYKSSFKSLKFSLKRDFLE